MTEGRRFRLAFLGTLTLTAGVALPVFSAFGLRGRPPGLSLRWRHAEAPAADLGFPWSPEAIPPAVRQARGFEDLMGVGLALAVVVLLIGCVTLASLVIRRGWDRRRELSVHMALGASKREVRSAILGELTPLLLAGTALGSGLALGLDAWLRSIAPKVLIPPDTVLSIPSALARLAPWRAVLAAASIEAAGAARRVRAPLHVDPAARLTRLALGAGHLAAAMGLLTTGALLARGATDVEGEVSLLTEPRDTLVIDLTAEGPVEIDRALRLVAHREGRQEPGWHLASAGAFEGLGVADRAMAECECALGTVIAPTVEIVVQHHSVSPGAFEGLGFRIIRGREFTTLDGPGTPGVAVVDARIDRRFRRLGVDPVGKLVRLGPIADFDAWYRIVGVVEVPEPPLLGTPERPMGNLYLSALQHPPSRAQLLVAGAADDPDPVLAALAASAPELAVRGVDSLLDRLRAWAAPIPWFSRLAALLAIAALAAAAQGLAASIALEVEARMQELGVRRALGARRHAIAASVLADVGRIVLWGGALGLAATAGLVRGLGDRFPALDRLDPGVALAVLAVLGLAVLAGALGPLRRAVRVTPVQAMGAME
ncbi:MAG: FtsX-like permease family protein [Gemmatimonadota bacterium]|nr:FtsX-like permease family protein [Gemmatimonadota bacterium]